MHAQAPKSKESRLFVKSCVVLDCLETADLLSSRQAGRDIILSVLNQITLSTLQPGDPVQQWGQGTYATTDTTLSKICNGLEIPFVSITNPNSQTFTALFTLPVYQAGQPV